jgi:hypothetical protein
VIEPNLDRVWAALMTGAKPAARRSPFFSSPPRDLKARRRFASQALRLKCDPRHPGALPDESRRRWRPIAQHRSAGGFEPAGERKVERFGSIFAPGDKVMQIENDYDKEVFNGDIGYVVDVDADAGELVASFDGHSVTYGFGELDTLVPAYAATIHKRQGSEYPARDHSRSDPALRDATAESPLHWRHPWQEARGFRWPEEGRRDRRSQCFGPATVVETRRLAAARRVARAAPGRELRPGGDGVPGDLGAG